jgi:Na+/H+ antiporter NhaD/arsenite permease-like protein
MSLGLITLAALALAILLSAVSRLHIGVLAIAFAWVIGVGVGGMTVGEVTSGFPVNLFLTLTGVSLLFSQASVNGTLAKVATLALLLCRGRVGLVPMLYFLVGAVLASAGPGNIATAGLLAPMAMATALRMKIPLFLMAIMVGNGANAGSLSPIAPTGIIVSGIMEGIGLDGLEIRTWLYNLVAHALVAFAAYFLFGGWALLRRAERVTADASAPEPFDRNNAITLGIIGLLILGVLTLGMHIGMAAFGAAVILSLFRTADDESALRAIPWSTILLVCGVTILVTLLERTDGMEILTDTVARVSTRATILPLVPALSASLGGGLDEAIASTMNVASHLVDVSPISTIGALAVASVGSGPRSRRLFNQLLAWGLSMTVAGALLGWLFS